MDELTTQVEQAQSGDLKAYGALVERFQDMVFAYAHALVGDFQLAQDAAQESFLHAWLSLGQVREPVAFAGWLRRVVYKHCDRIARARHRRSPLLADADGVASEMADPEQQLIERERRDRVVEVVAALPEHLRAVVELFYVGQHSHAEIAAFLGISAKTVKNRLYASRQRLKEEFEDMAAKTMQKKRPSRSGRFASTVLDDLTKLSDHARQHLLRRLDQKDVVRGLLGASDAVRDWILSGCSQRVQRFIREEMEAVATDIDEEEIREAQERIIAEFRELVPKPVFANADHRAVHRAVKRRLKKTLQNKPVSDMDQDELTELFMELSKVRTMDGVLALEEYEQLIRQDRYDKLFSVGLEQTISGSGSTKILERRLATWLQEQERRGKMIIDGIAGLQQRYTPDYMRLKLRAHYTLE